MTISRTVGTTGADHVDLNAWVAYVQANHVSAGNLTDHQIAKVKSVGFSPTTSQVVTGWAPGGSAFTTTITADTGASFRDHASVQTNAFYLNTANGAFIDGSSASSPTVDIAVDKCTLSDLQIRCSGGSYNTALEVSIVTATALAVDGCILVGTSAGGVLNCDLDADNLTVTNTLIEQRRGAAASSCIYFVGTAAHGGLNVYDCTLLSDSVGINFGSYGSGTVKGCFVGEHSAAAGTMTYPVNGREANVSGNNNATTKTSWTTAFGVGNLDSQLTGSQFSVVKATEFESGTVDFRLKSGLNKLREHGAAISGVTTDVARTVRPSGTVEDIGAWEYKVAGGATFANPLGLLGVGRMPAFA